MPRRESEPYVVVPMAGFAVMFIPVIPEYVTGEELPLLILFKNCHNYKVK